MNEALLSREYDLLPRLTRLSVPALVIHGEHDFISGDCAPHVAGAIHRARFVLLRETGHFSYLESPNEVHKGIRELI